MTKFILNGAAREINAEPGRTVLDHLRLHERLTGTKEGCAEGDCGACTIAIGKPCGDGLAFAAVNSCIMLADDLDGCAVVTAEGLATESGLAPVQEAMVECHASQCGFCTPGFVMSFFAYSQNPPPANQREGILDALAGNLCRCTGYRPIVAAAETLRFEADPRVLDWRKSLDALGSAAPLTLAGLDSALAANPAAKLVAGTTDLGVGIAKHGKVPQNMIHISRVAGLNNITEAADHIIIGATATYSEVLPYLQKHFPNFATLVSRIGSLQIRNRGTMGGNICNASPIGDSAPCLIALNGVLRLRSAQGERDMKIEEFFTGYRKTALRPGEYLRAIQIPYLKSGEDFFAYKLAKRFDQDISTVAAAFKVTLQNDKIISLRTGFGGMAATPLRAIEIENELLATGDFNAAAKLVASVFKPLSDLRASADYRLAAASAFIKRLGAQLENIESDIWAL
jgi:xanthine dehydrogenase small subunit